MSWFFGKKKHHRESPNSAENETSQSDDGYVVVGNNPDNDSDKPPSLYPSLSNITPYPPMPMAFPIPKQQTSQENNTNDISNIPFKFCKELERSVNQDSVIDQLRLDEISSFFKKINTTDYDYEFTLERSVIDEMESHKSYD